MKNHHPPCLCPSQKNSVLGLILSILLMPLATHAETPTYSGMAYLDNGVIRLGMNLDIGGAITWISKSGSDENVVNSHDWGRQVQMSFYSGPVPYEPEGVEVHPTWRFLGWNPIQSGDCYNNRSKVIDHRNHDDTLYVKCIPMQWPMNNVAGECTFEVWATLEDNTVRVRSKLNNARSDTTQYPARGQELPAVYTNGPYYRLFTYTGDAPFTKGPLHQVTKIWDTSLGVDVPGGPWDSWYATENWAALVREDDWGLGIWSPGSYRYTGGFAGKPGKGGPKDGPTGYFAPLRREILDHDIEYAYEYRLILGSLDAIREQVYTWQGEPAPPRYDFASNREGWTLKNAEDAGWQLDGVWRVSAKEGTPQLLGPDTLWKAEDMPKIRIRAAFEGEAETATLLLQRLGENGPGKIFSIPFPIQSDGEVRDYIVTLSEHPDYSGYCTQMAIEASVSKIALHAITPHE